MTKHPDSKLQRRLLQLRNRKARNEQKQKAKNPHLEFDTERSGRVWRKVTKEQLKEQETLDELREFA